MKWDEIKLPEKWTLSQAVEPQNLEQTKVQFDTKTPEGDVEVTFSSKPKSSFNLDPLLVWTIDPK